MICFLNTAESRMAVFFGFEPDQNFESGNYMENTLFTRSFRMITICEFATRFSPMSSRKMIRHRDTETSIDIQLDIYVYIWYRLYGNIMNKNIHDVHLYNICLSRRCL